MEKIALITDTTCDLDLETIKKLNVFLLPFRIIYKDREFKDRIEITPQKVYESLDSEVPTSSLPSMKDMEDVFTKLEEDGYTHAIGITLSSGLSGIHNALTLVSENHPSITSYIYDSKTISLGEGVIVKECAKLIEEGKSFDYIKKQIDITRKKTHLYFVVDTLEYLKRGGRIGKVAGTIAELLHVKPIISVDDEGRYYTYKKVRGRKQSLAKIVDTVNELLDKKRCSVFILNGHGYEDSKKVYEQIKNHPNIIASFLGGEISPVSGVHSGPGLVGVVCVEE